MISALAALALCLQDVETFDCESTDGWGILDTSGGAAAPELRAASGRAGAAVEMRFERTAGAVVALVHGALLTDLRHLRFDVRSDRPCLLVINIEDRDGATFHYAVEVGGGDWRAIDLAPSDFSLNEDSPVFKPSMNPARLGTGFALIDLNGTLGEGGASALRVDNVRVERAGYARSSIPAVVDRAIEIRESTAHDGDIEIREGGSLRVTAPRFVLHGNLRITGGSFEVSGGVLILPAESPHERQFRLEGGRLTLQDFLMVSSQLVSVEAAGASRFEIDGMKTVGGPFSANIGENCTLTIRRASLVGEFIIGPTSHVSVDQADQILLWITFAAGMDGTVRLPDPDGIEGWTFDRFGYDIRLNGVSAASWGVITAPGCDITLEDSRIGTIATTFWTASQVSDVRNGGSSAQLELGDRRLVLRNSTVDVWNFYTIQEESTFSDCLLGECWAMGDSRLTLENSTVDGRGGYVLSKDTSTFRLVGCTLTCPVVAEGESTLILERCEVVGDVTARDQSTIRLVDTQVSGEVRQLDGGRVDRD